MLRISSLSLGAILLTMVGCDSDDDKDTGSATAPAAGASSDSDAEWSDVGEDDSSDKEDDWEGGDDSGKSDFAECGDEVVAGAACEGGWEDTLCLDDVGQMWWCEGGVWTSEKEE